jgi:hypothetical protein
MQFAVALEVVQPAESHLARLADEWFLVAVRKQMALQVVVSSELGLAVRALVFL